MDGNTLPHAVMRWLTPAIALGLLGGTGAGLAQDTDLRADYAVMAEAPAPDLPSFQPSDEAAFEAAFATYAEPASPALPDHAVDITDIEPAEPSATPIGPGIASYYGRRFHGRPTASGEPFDMNDLTAAHKTLPFGSRVRVTNTRNGASVIVRVNDRGPFVRGRDIDLSRKAAEQIGIVSSGHGRVELELLDS
ncbi:septal ring lytic transglycosylase RlpA family protein [Aurantiacibacter poecillastricola]|uniref:septal ring lytic transglycosylase RlpA family protein n=1 Tax=Aurantiacibacter poecillastricola TaxID=3064385 RepID=UPI00273D78B0|nr:septal ring lytic transglycosylase RlpA family protein [Aurantiacibacter sp. 219JJ12-13]MDP5261666.1 septal ring lytic transglycosylase RlpA family protein [Aurantiacibacter sp. 219JJ12-13]